LRSFLAFRMVLTLGLSSWHGHPAHGAHEQDATDASGTAPLHALASWTAPVPWRYPASKTLSSCTSQLAVCSQTQAKPHVADPQEQRHRERLIARAVAKFATSSCESCSSCLVRVAVLCCLCSLLFNSGGRPSWPPFGISNFQFASSLRPPPSALRPTTFRPPPSAIVVP
jgi:hypothetical protein